MPKRRTQKIGGSQEINPDDVTLSGDKLLADTQTLDQIISGPERRNQTAIFSSLLGQFNNLSRESIENINKIRRDILYLEQNKYKIEQRHQDKFDDKKKGLEELIMEETKLNDSIEKLIDKHNSLLSQLKKKTELFFANIRKKKDMSSDYLRTSIYDDDIRELYPMSGGGKSKKKKREFKKHSKKSLKKKNFKKK